MGSEEIDGFIVGPKLYDYDEAISDSEFSTTQYEFENCNFNETLLKGGDVAPHILYNKNVKDREADEYAKMLEQAKLGMIRSQQRDAMTELNEALKHVHTLHGRLIASRQLLVKDIVNAEACFSSIGGMVHRDLEQATSLAERNIIGPIESSLGRLQAFLKQTESQEQDAYAMVATVDRLREAALQLHFRIFEHEKSAQTASETAGAVRALQNEVKRIEQNQISLRNRLEAKPRQHSSNWTGTHVVKLASLCLDMQRAFERVAKLVGGEERSQLEQFAHHAKYIAHLLSEQEAAMQMAPMAENSAALITAATLSETKTASLTSSADEKAIHSHRLLTENSSLASQLAFSTESFSSAKDSFVNLQTAHSARSEAKPDDVAKFCSSRAQVDITESEVRPLFVSTTVTEDKNFVSPFPQSPLCRTAAELTSVETARTPNCAALTDTGCCRTAAAISSPRSRRNSLGVDDGESLVEPAGLKEAVAHLATAIGSANAEELLRTLTTARSLSATSLNTAFSFHDLKTAREDEKRRGLSWLSCKPKVRKPRRLPAGRESFIPMLLKWIPRFASRPNEPSTA